MIFIKIGIIFCGLSVILGAFGAHSLERIIDDKMDIFKTGIQYQIFHSLALIMTGILSRILEIDLSTSGYLFVAGIILFSGALYLIAIYKFSSLGIIAPIGGALFIFGWISLLYQVVR